MNTEYFHLNYCAQFKFVCFILILYKFEENLNIMQFYVYV
jgi:hypothetical protein